MLRYISLFFTVFFSRQSRFALVSAGLVVIGAQQSYGAEASSSLQAGLKAEYGSDPFVPEGHHWANLFLNWNASALFALRLGYGFMSSSVSSDSGEVSSKEQRIDLGATWSYVPQSGPYLLANWSGVKKYSDLGDVFWNEFSGGLGGRTVLDPFVSLFMEIEIKSIQEYTEPIHGNTQKGIRTQFNAGILVTLF